MDNFWLKIKHPILVLAPMAGITDYAFRQICHNYGADVVYTEMVSIDALYYDSKKTLEMLKTAKKEKPVVLQLFGKRPELVAKAVKHVEEAGFDGIDINFGCPAKKVVAHEGGVTLLRNLDLAYELVQAVTEVATVPVSVKTRLGIKSATAKNGFVSVFDFIEKIKDLPVSTLMIHGRTYEGGFSAPIDLETIKKVKQAFKGIVIGNGGLNTPEDAQNMVELTGVNGVAFARGVYGQPWIFEQTKKLFKSKKYKNFDLAQIKKVALEHAQLLEDSKGDKGFLEIRKHLCWYFRGFPQASQWRQKLVQVEDTKQLKQILKQM